MPKTERFSQTSFQKSLQIAIAALVAVALISILAGDLKAGEHRHKKCSADTQQCLDKMAAKIRSKGWLGIDTEKVEGGWYQVTAVTPDSPAAAAGLRPGDVLLALNGVKLNGADKAALKKVKKTLTAGASANYVIKRDGTKQQVAVTLGQVPETQVAEWIGQHLLEHHATERVASVN